MTLDTLMTLPVCTISFVMIGFYALPTGCLHGPVAQWIRTDLPHVQYRRWSTIESFECAYQQRHRVVWTAAAPPRQFTSHTALNLCAQCRPAPDTPQTEARFPSRPGIEAESMLIDATTYRAEM